MENSTVLVTGSSRGFGWLTVRTLATKGHHVFASMRNINGKNADKARELQEWARAQGYAVDVVELDVTDEVSIEQAVETIIKSAGQLDVVVHNAGIGAFGVNEAFTTAQLTSLFDVNVLGIHRVNRAVLPHMRAQNSGLLVYVTSALGRMIVPTMGTYSASKFATEALAESYHYNLAPLGIDTVIVEPTGYLTDGFYTDGQLPQDVNRIAQYGSVAETVQQLGEGYAQMLQAPDAPQPQEVADLIVDLIQTPTADRPLRVTVGQSTEGVAVINGTTEQVQSQIFDIFGVSHMLQVS